jgi:hypothetical protein
VATSLTRSRVCSFEFLLGTDSAAFLRSESLGTHEHNLLSLFLRLTQPRGTGSGIYFPQEQVSPVIPPGIGFVVSYFYSKSSSFFNYFWMDLLMWGALYPVSQRYIDTQNYYASLY